MDNITVIYLNLPVKIKGFVVHNTEDNYNTIVLNCKHSYFVNIDTYNHELKHINSMDFNNFLNAASLETIRHRA